MQTTVETQQRKLIKKFHTLLGKAVLGSDGKEVILSGYGATSTKDLSIRQLTEICNALELRIKDDASARSGGHVEMDKWRKRVLAAICALHETNDRQAKDKIAYAKGTALRCLGMKDDVINASDANKLFNAVSRSDLQTIYNWAIRSKKICRTARMVEPENIGKEIQIFINKVSVKP